MNLLELVDLVERLVLPERLEPKGPPAPDPHPVVQAVAYAAAAEVLAGPDSTLLDRAAFVASPFAIEAMAEAGAGRGAAELAALGPGPEPIVEPLDHDQLVREAYEAWGRYDEEHR